MNYIQAIILGIVQGLTEFIPISSTAHLVFVSRWTNIYSGDPAQITATMAVVQLGTLAAVFAYFASDIYGISTAFVRDHWAFITRKRIVIHPGTHGVRPIWLSNEAWLGWLIIVGSIPIGVIGLTFKDTIEGPGTKNLWFISVMLIAIGLLLGVAERVGTQRKTLDRLGMSDAIIVGIAQAIALMPGTSRSGSTIMGGLFSGQTRETAARFSFLLSIPAISASGLLELHAAWQILPDESFMPLFVATLTAAIVGYFAIWFLIAFLRKRSTAIFIVYRLILGTVILALLYFGVIDASVN